AAGLANPGGSNGNFIPYAMSFAWDPINLKARFIGSDHITVGGPMPYIIWDATTNSWSRTDLYPTLTTQHCYDHNILDPATGSLYYVPYASRNIYKIPSGSATPTLVTVRPESLYWEITQGLAWWSGSLAGAGSNGVVIFYNSGAPNGELQAYDIQSGNW